MQVKQSKSNERNAFSICMVWTHPTVILEYADYRNYEANYEEIILEGPAGRWIDIDMDNTNLTTSGLPYHNFAQSWMAPSKHFLSIGGYSFDSN